MNLCCAKEPVDVTLDPDGRLRVKPHLLQCSQRFYTQFSTHFLQTGCLSAAVWEQSRPGKGQINNPTRMARRPIKPIDGQIEPMLERVLA